MASQRVALIRPMSSWLQPMPCGTWVATWNRTNRVAPCSPTDSNQTKFRSPYQALIRGKIRKISTQRPVCPSMARIFEIRGDLESSTQSARHTQDLRVCTCESYLYCSFSHSASSAQQRLQVVHQQQAKSLTGKPPILLRWQMPSSKKSPPEITRLPIIWGAQSSGRNEH